MSGPRHYLFTETELPTVVPINVRLAKILAALTAEDVGIRPRRSKSRIKKSEKLKL